MAVTPLTEVEAYERFMGRQTLIFPAVKDPSAEFSSPPAFLDVFYSYCGLLSQEELWWHYYSTHRDTLLALRYNDRPVSIPALEARVYRAYPSLVRERHLYLLLNDRGGFDAVVRTNDLDKRGVDYLVVQGSQAFGVRAYILTDRSLRFRDHKNTKSTIGIPVDMPLDLANAPTIGPFSVYGEEHLNELRRTVRARTLAYAS